MISLFFLYLCFYSFAFATTSSSANYQFSGEVVSVGGQSSSANYSVQLSSGNELGSAGSANYQATGQDLFVIPAVTTVANTPTAPSGSSRQRGSRNNLSTDRATNITPNSVTLNAEVRDEDDWDVYFVISSQDAMPGCSDEEYRVDVGGSYGENDDITLNINGLQPNTTYYYQVCGSNGGSTKHGTIQSFTTTAAGTLSVEDPEPVATTTETVGLDLTQELDETVPCNQYITEYILPGRPVSVAQVMRLQEYLNTYEGELLPVSGIYDPQTQAAVIRYQEKYAPEILGPWGITEGTGLVYTTTSAHINKNLCGKQNTDQTDVPLQVEEPIEITQQITEATRSLVDALIQQIQALGQSVSEIFNPPTDPDPATGNTFSSIPDSCPSFVVGRIQFNNPTNNPQDVVNLQTYLNVYENESLALDGIYDVDDVAAVKRYQEKYRVRILDPWGLDQATGDVYVSTVKHVNSIVCGGTGMGVDEDQYPELFDDEDYGFFDTLLGSFI